MCCIEMMLAILKIYGPLTVGQGPFVFSQRWWAVSLLLERPANDIYIYIHIYIIYILYYIVLVYIYIDVQCGQYVP